MTIMRTPGPWNYEKVRKGETDFRAPLQDHDWCITGPDDICPAIVWEFSEGEANARLIAAAPELLAACEELIESAEYWSEYEVPLGIVDRLKAAVAKAKGTA